MVYGSWSRGYKTGGWTTRITSPLPFAPDYDEEKAETWEMGFKSMLFDRRLRINAAAFTNKYKGIQLNFQEGVSPTLQNAGDARIKGFEVEAVAVPAQGLTINGAIGYLDASYLNVAPQSQVVPNALQAGVFAGAQLPKNAKWKFSVSPRYELALRSGAAFVFIADYSWSSKLWNDPERTYLIRREATGIVNASVTFKAPRNWELTFGATNLTNERYLVSGLAQIAGGAIAGSWSRPAEWYARLGVSF
jgi:iron complex outermembrane receptor protein